MRPRRHHQPGRTQGRGPRRRAGEEVSVRPRKSFPERGRLSATSVRPMNTISALAGVVIKELYRRKDFYVLFVLTAVITLAIALVNFFHDSSIVRHIKEICLL